MGDIEGTRGDDYLWGWMGERGASNRHYGLEGDDKFGFEALGDEDRFYGGPGDDTLFDLDFFLPLEGWRADKGIHFDGGPGHDTLEMELTAQDDGLKVKLGEIYGRLTSVEDRLVTLTLDSQDGSSLTKMALKGSGGADSLTLTLDDGTGADGNKFKLGGGDDAFTLDHAPDGEGYGKLKVALGKGHDTYRSELHETGGSDGGTVKVKGGDGDDRFHLGGSVEKAKGGAGDDVFDLAMNNVNLAAPDLLSGGDGEDTFLFAMRPLSGGIRAEVKDFTSGEDKIVVENFLLSQDSVTDFARIGPFDDWDFSAMQYDPTTGLVYYGRSAVLDLGAGTEAVSSDFVMVKDFDWGA